MTVTNPFTEFNEHRLHPVDWAYSRGRLAQPINCASVHTVEEMACLLRAAADTLETSPPTDVETMADLWCFLDQARHAMPLVECWLVVKHYKDPDPTSHWHGRSTVWCGATTREQAHDLAEAIEEHYATKYPHLRRDEFKVDFGPCRALDIVAPGRTVEQYLAGLG